MMKPEHEELSERNSAIAKSLLNSVVASENDQFECYGIFYLNKWTGNEDEIKKTLRDTVKLYSKCCQRGVDQ